jgi:hypothetical protein
MTLKQWAENGWLRPHQTSAREIRDLLRIVERDLKDADGGISTDVRELKRDVLDWLAANHPDLC